MKLSWLSITSDCFKFSFLIYSTYSANILESLSSW